MSGVIGGILINVKAKTIQTLLFKHFIRRNAVGTKHDYSFIILFIEIAYLHRLHILSWDYTRKKMY